jgi:hypothetical protein
VNPDDLPDLRRRAALLGARAERLINEAEALADALWELAQDLGLDATHTDTEEDE